MYHEKPVQGYARSSSSSNKGGNRKNRSSCVCVCIRSLLVCYPRTKRRRWPSSSLANISIAYGPLYSFGRHYLDGQRERETHTRSELYGCVLRASNNHKTGAPPCVGTRTYFAFFFKSIHPFVLAGMNAPTRHSTRC